MEEGVGLGLSTYKQDVGQNRTFEYAKQVNETLGVSPDEAFEVGMRNFGERLHRRIAYDAAFSVFVMTPSTPASRMPTCSPAGWK
jgi:hypothetical protein